MSEQTNDIGQTLKAERERRGLALEMVHEATKIPIDSLRAIEEGYKVRTLSPFYYKSFVRIYAQYLGLDGHAILEQFAVTSAIPKKVPQAEGPSASVSKKVQETISMDLFARSLGSGRRNNALVPVLIGLLIAACVAGAAFWFMKHSARQAVAPAKSDWSKSGKSVTSSTSKKEAARKETTSVRMDPVQDPVRVPVQENNRSPKPNEDMPKPTASEKKAEENFVPAAKSGRSVEVSVRAVGNAWITVKVDGGTVFQGILKKGNNETWSGTKKIELSGKDIDQLAFEVNGKNIGRLSNREMKARKIVVTPEGLTVEK